MIDSLFNTFYYLERHLGWKIKIGFLTKDNKYIEKIITPNKITDKNVDKILECLSSSL